jgi:HSP20 family protein
MTEVKDDKKLKINKKEDTEPKREKEENESKGELEVRRTRPLALFGEMDRFFQDIDRFFRDFWTPSRLWDYEPLSLRVFDEDKFFRTPLTNITDEGDHFSITAELPGLEKGDIELTVHDGNLEIKGEQKIESEDKSEGYVRREYSTSSYYRSFKLPENIDEDKIDATLEKGILKLNLPKSEVPKPEKKQIEVK